MTIIGLSGKRGSGKDTLAAQMAPLGWQRMSFADELKRRCRQDFGLTVDQTDGVLKESPTQYRRTDGSFFTPRDIMCRCGFYFRSIDPMFFVRKTYQQIHLASRDMSDSCSTRPGQQKFVITDVRFKNEANYIRDNGGIIVRLVRDEALNVYKGKSDDPSETDLDDYRFDYVIDSLHNRTVEDLVTSAKCLERLYGNL